MEINPYDPRQPSEPEFFVGRMEYLKKFRRNTEKTLHGTKPTSVAILGDWGVGKSSLLLKLKSVLDEYKDIITIRISLGSDVSDYYSFSQFLVDKINIELSKNRKLSQKIREGVFQWKFEEANLGFATMKKKKAMYLSTGNMLIEYNLKTLCDEFLFKDKIKLIVLLIDDIHNLTKKDNDALLALRDLFQSLVMDGYMVQLVFTAPKNIFYDVKQIAEPVVRFFEKFYLEPFNKNEATEFLISPLKKTSPSMRFTGDAILYLYEKTGGHPYFLAFIAQKLIDLVDGEVGTDFIKNHWKFIFKELIEEKFEKDIGRISAEKSKLLIKIAKSENETVSPKEIGGYHQYYSDLVQSEMLIRADRGKYSLYHPLFKEYLKQVKQ